MGDNRAPAALLIIDMINRLDFEGAAPLREAADRIVEPILTLRTAADAARLPVVYVNDNYGAWRSDTTKLVEDVIGSDHPGRELAERLKPREQDYFVVKPQFSGFYATTLPALLPRLGVDRLVISGIAADICVLFTAADAHMREYDLWVPCDAVAGEHDERTRWAVEIMRNSFGADTRATDEQTLDDWITATRSRD
ncbi:MAG: cysteine hydrolase family protein [Sphingomonas sp.]